MEENKIVHFNLFNPTRALFKQNKNSRAEVDLISCSNSDNCNLFDRGECVCMAGLWGKRCKYGRKIKQIGFTPRARKFSSWCEEQRKKYEGVGFLKSPESLGIVGDFVFLPYAHMDMAKGIPWEGSLLKIEDFTVDNIIFLVKFKPQAMLGGEIRSYQKKIPPIFLKHLSEQFPELFKQVVDSDDYSRSRFSEFTNIGRKAILETTTKDVGQYKDIHGGLWAWDGSCLHSENSHASFMLVSEFKKITIIPEAKQVVKITDENQVNKSTVFID